tara:strand:- start:39 stop:776 length:738 start_codon:yes stop_codon:yes gene_type:complete
LRYYKVNGIEHKVYDPDDRVKNGLVIIGDWRYSRIGDWVKSDDDCIIQVLRRGNMLRKYGRNKVREYVGTCTGTFPVGPNVKMDTNRRVNIYTFGGDKNSEDILLDRTKLTRYEVIFVTFLASGLSPQEAYLKAYPTKNRNYAAVKSAQLFKTERILTAMKEELKPVMEKLEVDPEYVIKGIKDSAEGSEKEDVRLRALFKLSDILDLEDKNQTKITQVTGALFQGFSTEALEEAARVEPKKIDG